MNVDFKLMGFPGRKILFGFSFKLQPLGVGIPYRFYPHASAHHIFDHAVGDRDRN